MFRTFASQSEALGFFSKAAENKYVSRGPFVLCKSVLRHTDGCNFLQLSGLNEALAELQTMLESSNLSHVFKVGLLGSIMSRHNCLFCFLPPNFEALRTDYSVSAGLLLKSVTLSPCTQGWMLREDGFDLLSARLLLALLLNTSFSCCFMFLSTPGFPSAPVSGFC